MTQKEVMQNLDKNIPLSKYFTWSEALWMEKSHAYALPTDEQIHNIINMAQALDNIRGYYNKPIKVHSWLRTPAHNQLIKGATKSAHLEGLAVDFTIPGVNVHKIQEELSKNVDLWPHRVEQATPTWVHVDLRPGHRLFYP